MLESALPKMITIQTKLAGDLCPIAADLTQMEQMVMNLATNAADAMDQGGTLVMETNRERARGQICLACGKAFSGEYAVLTVADMGQGIEADTRERIFEPFFTTKELGKGTGLGLSTVYGVVKVHGGHIQCQSQVGVGTTFKIFLPCHEEKAAVLKAGNGRIVEPKGGSETILLVEDEVPLRALGERFLRSKGYQVLTAPSGEEALELYRVESAKVDLVVLDLSMPGMGGRRCLKELLALDPGAKVVIASGYAGDGQIKDALKSGALAYVAKPFRRAELLTTIREVLDRATPPA
jgi:CheY-like chemotaxis protein